MKKPPESPDQKSELSRGSFIYWIFSLPFELHQRT